MPKKKQVMGDWKGRGISRRRFLEVTAGTTAALSFGTFIRSGLGAGKLEILMHSNTLNVMDDVLRDHAKRYTREKGIEIRFQFVGESDLPTKTAAIAETGAGPDIVELLTGTPHLYAYSLADVSDVAEALGKQLKGWTNIARDIARVGNSWRAVPWGLIPTMINYRSDWLEEVGYDKFPATYDEMLVMAKKLKDKGHPVGFALGRAMGDANQSCYSFLWSFGGTECKPDGRTVDINSPGTAKAVDWRRTLHEVGETDDVLSWDDSSNNRAFLAEAISVTSNAASIYWAEKANAPHLRAVTNHAAWPQGPGGRISFSSSYNLGILKFSKVQREAKDFITWLIQPQQYSPWLGVGEGLMAGLLNYYEDDPVWKTGDPKLEVARLIPKYVRIPGYPGPPTRRSAEAMAKMVIVNMFARAAKGMSTPDTVKQAEADLKEIYSKS